MNINRRNLTLGLLATALAAPTLAHATDLNLGLATTKVTGAPTSRTFGDRLGFFKNVKDYGAIGDGVADDTAAIQAAVDRVTAPYSSLRRGTIYFPAGSYKLTAPVTFETPNMDIVFLGEGGAELVGNFADALLKRSVNSPIGGVHAVENIRFTQNSANGKGLMIHSCVGAKVVNCAFSNGVGSGGTGANLAAVETYNSQACTLDTCSIIGWSVGVMAGNGTSILNCDITGCVHGIRHQNVGLIVHGGRYEVNTIAVALGLDQNGAGFSSAGVSIKGISAESNGWFLQAFAAGGVAISGGSFQNAVANNNGLFYFQTASEVTMNGVVCGSAVALLDSGIRCDNLQNSVFNGVSVNLSAGPVAWKVQFPRNNRWIACPEQPEISDYTADTQMNGSSFRTIRITNASARSLFFRNDTAMNGDGGVPPLNVPYALIVGGAGDITVATDGASPPTLLTPGGKNRLSGQGNIGFFMRTAANTWVTWGSAWQV